MSTMTSLHHLRQPQRIMSGLILRILRCSWSNLEWAVKVRALQEPRPSGRPGLAGLGRWMLSVSGIQAMLLHIAGAPVPRVLSAM